MKYLKEPGTWNLELRTSNLERSKILLVIFLLLVLPKFLSAQQPVKVGVVLSGGGAKGYAYVGALKVLEEAGIRVDFVGGTSMGAIVGGMYAAGWTPAEMDSLLHATDIMGAFQETKLREDRSFFEKQYGEKYGLSLSMQDFKVVLPTAFSNGQEVFNLFSQFTANVNHIRDFNELPIPFLCIGTDVVTGEEVLMNKGVLPLAMRASGALPGLLTPVKVDGRLITDGGLVNNFPAQEVRDQGMDIVIGISVEDSLYTEEELNSFDKIISQISVFESVRRSKEQREYCDVFIKPELEGYGVTSFDAVDTLIERGEQAARAMWDELVEIARIQQEAGTPVPVSKTPLLQDTFWVKKILIKDSSEYSKLDIPGNLYPAMPGKITNAEFYECIHNLCTRGYFNHVHYWFEQSEDGSRVLHLEPELKPGYDRQLRLGLHYDQVYQSSLLFNLTFLNLGLKNSIASADLILGDNFRYNFNYLVDNNKGPDVGINSYLRFNNIDYRLPTPIVIDSMLELEEVTFDFFDVSGEIYLRFSGNNNHSSGLAGELKYFRSSSDQIESTCPASCFLNDKQFYLNLYAFFYFDNLDNSSLPMRGTSVDFKTRAIYPFSGDETGQSWSYNFDLSFQKAFPVSSRFSLGIAGNAGITLETPAKPYYYYIGSTNQNLINNFKSFTGLKFAEKVGKDLFTGQLYGRYRLFQDQYLNHYLTLSSQFAYLNEALSESDDQWTSYYSLGLGYALDTPLGPIELIYGLSNESSLFSFNFGFWF